MGKMIELTASDGHKLAAYRADPAGKPKAQAQQHARWARSPCLGLCDQAPAALEDILWAVLNSNEFILQH